MPFLVERVGGWGSASIDEEAGFIRGVKILGMCSSNRRRYLESAMQKARSLYEGVGVNLNHHQSETDRAVGDGIGRLRNVAFREQALWGDLEYLKTHPYTPQLLECARRMPEQLGLSHVASGSIAAASGADGEEIIESIDQVRSVDLVRYPATTKGLFESRAGNADGFKRQKFCESVLALLEDDSLPLEKLKEQLTMTANEKTAEQKAAEEKALKESQQKAADEAAKKAAEEAALKEAEKKLGTAITEKVTALESKLSALEHSHQLMECVNAHRIDMSALSEQQLVSLKSKKDRKEMDTFAESLPDAVRMGARPYMPPRPEQSKGTYAQLRQEFEESLK